MVASSPLLSRSPVRITLAVGILATFVVAGTAAIGAQSTVRHWANALQWMPAEHQTAPPYFDTARNLKLGHTPQAKCGPGSRPETSWQGRVPAKDYTGVLAPKASPGTPPPAPPSGTRGGNPPRPTSTPPGTSAPSTT